MNIYDMNLIWKWCNLMERWESCLEMEFELISGKNSQNVSICLALLNFMEPLRALLISVRIVFFFNICCVNYIFPFSQFRRKAWRLWISFRSCPQCIPCQINENRWIYRRTWKRQKWAVCSMQTWYVIYLTFWFVHSVYMNFIFLKVNLVNLLPR